jgi:hypothetical protein
VRRQYSKNGDPQTHMTQLSSRFPSPPSRFISVIDTHVVLRQVNNKHGSIIHQQHPFSKSAKKVESVYKKALTGNRKLSNFITVPTPYNPHGTSPKNGSRNSWPRERTIFNDLQQQNRCFRCGTIGHWAKDCYASDETVYNFRMETGLCLECGSPYHFARSCPDPDGINV